MPSRRSVVLLLSQCLMAGTILGCQSTPPKAPPTPPPAATPDVVGSLQSELQAKDPASRVGTVAQVRPANSLAAIMFSTAGSTAAPVKVGDIVTFLTSDKKPIASGSVVSVDNDVIVSNYVPTAGGHAPAEGDLAVRLSGPK